MYPTSSARISLLCIGLFAASCISAADKADKISDIPSQPAFQAAVEAYQQNRPDTAKKYFLELLEQFPNSPEILNNLAVIEVQQGNRNRAIEMLKTALAADISIYIAYQNLSRIYSHTAAQAYRNALSLESESPDPLKLKFIDQPDTRVPKIEEPLDELLLKNKQIEQPLVEEPEQASINVPEKDQLLNTIHQWAKAWSQQNLEAYFSSYAENYAPPGETNKRWKAQRLRRISDPDYIRIKLSHIRLTTLAENKAKAVFRQNYKSNRLDSTVTKQLIMKHTGKTWLITDERVISR